MKHRRETRNTTQACQSLTLENVHLNGDLLGIGRLAGVLAGVPESGVVDQQGGAGRVTIMYRLHFNLPTFP